MVDGVVGDNARCGHHRGRLFPRREEAGCVGRPDRG